MRQLPGFEALTLRRGPRQRPGAGTSQGRRPRFRISHRRDGERVEIEGLRKLRPLRPVGRLQPDRDPPRRRVAILLREGNPADPPAHAAQPSSTPGRRGFSGGGFDVEDWKFGLVGAKDPATGAILFRHNSLVGIPDRVVEGDGYTLEFIGPTLLCLDIQDPSGMARLLAEPLKAQLPINV